jgi:hypothetical protein
VDWSRQTLHFGCDMELRAAAEIVARALGMPLQERRHDQLGTSFGADDPSGGFVSVRESPPADHLGEDLPSRLVAALPTEPVTVYIHATGRADEIVAALTAVGCRLRGRAPHPPAYVQMADAAWLRLLPELRAQGWEVRLTGYEAPLQIEGSVPSGESFYYRCRHQTCSLGIGGEDPVAEPDWEGEAIVEGGEYAASHIEPDAAVGILRSLHEEWRHEAGPGRSGA